MYESIVHGLKDQYTSIVSIIIITHNSTQSVLEFNEILEENFSH